MTPFTLHMKMITAAAASSSSSKLLLRIMLSPDDNVLSPRVFACFPFPWLSDQLSAPSAPSTTTASTTDPWGGLGLASIRKPPSLCEPVCQRPCLHAGGEGERQSSRAKFVIAAGSSYLISLSLYLSDSLSLTLSLTHSLPLHDTHHPPYHTRLTHFVGRSPTHAH